MSASQAPQPPTCDLPLFDWAEEQFLVTKDGKKLKRWGRVVQACAILDDCDREEVTDLIKAKLIRGYKLKPHRPNSHWRVDLLSVWRHKQAQMRD